MNILAANGFTQLFHMLGGITAWTAAGYPTVHE
jgi:rhodanese-related sulfurtransferase